MRPETDSRLHQLKVPGVSVVICCYNSSLRISETLRHLAKQVVDETIGWEIIIVDNCSVDNTREVAEKFWSSEGRNTPLRMVREETPGLSYARNRGVIEACFGIIIFCDDDNWLCDNYVQSAHSIMLTDKRIGIAGGWCKPDVHDKFDNWMIPFLPALAVGKPGAKTMYLKKLGKTVNGAGMVVRKEYYNNITQKGFSSLLSDRTQNTLSSGGDTELCWVMMYSGYDILFDESLFFRHFIPASRLKKDYLLKLTLSSLYPSILLNIYSFLFWNDQSGFGKFFVKEFVKKIYMTLYFLPRIVLGKYPLYSSVVFRQNIKMLGLLIYSFHQIRKDFNRIGFLRRVLA